MMAGRTTAPATVAQRAAVEQATTGITAGALDEFLVAARDGRVVSMGGQWVIAASHEARVAIEAGLVAKIGDHEQARLKPTKAGRHTLGQICWEHISAKMQMVEKAYQRGWWEATQAYVPAVPSRPRWRRALSVAVGGLLLFAAGGATAILAAQIGSGQ
ncbi:hypothetical protein [Micromonospora craterilacus]|uniref:hypothetical protein n=1 Tax=Micromonospora craterilacus TaxID=1655439 RepID=UPI0011B7DEB7|nr:hypothetical protein [Micromonospora craterilacus]